MTRHSFHTSLALLMAASSSVASPHADVSVNATPDNVIGDAGNDAERRVMERAQAKLARRALRGRS